MSLLHKLATAHFKRNSWYGSSNIRDIWAYLGETNNICVLKVLCGFGWLADNVSVSRENGALS